MDAELMLTMLLKDSIEGSWVCNSIMSVGCTLSKLSLDSLLVVRGVSIGIPNHDFYVKEVNTIDIKELIAIKLELDWIKALNINKSFCSQIVHN